MNATVIDRNPATSNPSTPALSFPIHIYGRPTPTSRKVLTSLLGQDVLYELPGDPSRDTYIIPVSGGADSAALAIAMHELFPHQRFELVFTDTMADEPEIYNTLDALEIYLGRPITRISPERGLYELIEHYNGYLPSPQARWCTRILKLETFKPWLAQFDGIQKHMFIGIRADEATRLAFTIEDATTHMPFIDLRLKREDIFTIMQRTIGIPRFYTRRTRSGCSLCPFQRKSERVGLLQEQPAEFLKGMKFEKLDHADANRHEEAPPLWQDSRIAENWHGLPLPSSDVRLTGRQAKRTTVDLFGERGIFVGGEFFMDGLLSNDEFVWHQRVISYSTTRAGLARQIDDRFQHLLATSEVFDMTPDEVRAKAKFAIWFVELPETVFDPDSPTDTGYTWHKDSSYKQLRHIVQWTTRALKAESLRLQSQRKASRLTSVEYEWIEASKVGLANLEFEVGRVTASQWYVPQEKVRSLSAEEEFKTAPCPMCHL